MKNRWFMRLWITCVLAFGIVMADRLELSFHGFEISTVFSAMETDYERILVEGGKNLLKTVRSDWPLTADVFEK